MLKNDYYIRLCLGLCLGLLFLSSCVVTKKSVYFTDIPDSTKLRIVQASEFVDPTIKPDDVMSITIQTIDPLSSASINKISELNSNLPSAPSMQPPVPGFLVDKDGNVSIPMLGNVKISGLTTYEAKKVIQDKASLFFKDPTVQVRYANYKVTVIGEVAKPATYIVSNEKVTLLDALGLAGDLTIYGKRENVLLVRDNNGRKEFVRFNLNSSDVFKSPYFYLMQNDVVYVEPGKGKVAANNAARTQTIAIIGSLLSVLIVALSRF